MPEGFVNTKKTRESFTYEGQQMMRRMGMEKENNRFKF